MEIELLKEQKQRLNNRLLWIDTCISSYIDGRYGEMGLIDDTVKTPAFAALKQERHDIFQELRDFNQKYAKTIHKANSK